jgi:hypothetical protein
MGQVTNPVHTEALKLFYAGLLKAGITQNELDLMSRRIQRHCSNSTNTYLRKGRHYGS